MFANNSKTFHQERTARHQRNVSSFSAKHFRDIVAYCGPYKLLRLRSYISYHLSHVSSYFLLCQSIIESSFKILWRHHSVDVAERKRQVTPVKEVLEKQDEEEWCLRDVIFVEDSKTVPIGKVVKVQ